MELWRILTKTTKGCLNPIMVISGLQFAKMVIHYEGRRKHGVYLVLGSMRFLHVKSVSSDQLLLFN
ncbi:hypothetical protein HOLleu_15593 [Holothuria leucospilota]|uniref:Uncharacterized protein n=1 Tax=Holothuria leucospilota TaxID=206669 RepID=A0A9Q1H786_HOLLE|nr:hypothetical protein HOLleu_15593 [Holothuria leucospilota]